MPIAGVPAGGIFGRIGGGLRGPTGGGGGAGGRPGGTGPASPGPAQPQPTGPIPTGPAPAPQAPAFNPLTINAGPSPEMQEAIAAWKKQMADLEAQAGKVDPNQQFLIDELKKRLSTDTTQRSIDRASSAIRDQAAGLEAGADVAAAGSGRGPGFAAGGIGGAAQRAQAKAAADIELGRQKDLDALVTASNEIMSGPARQALQYRQTLASLYPQNPFLATANLGLQQQRLGLDAYLGQLNAQNQAAQTQAQLYGSPMEMFRILYGGL